MSKTTVIKLLNSIASGEEWSAVKTKEGKSKESYIATSQKRTVFLKYDVQGDALRILGDMSIAPKLLRAGTFQRRPYTIQKYIEGAHPATQWVRDNLQTLGKFFASFHRDKTLKAVLSKDVIQKTNKHIKEELDDRREWVQDNIHKKKQSQYVSKLEQLYKTSKSIENSHLTVVHADPNLTNFILDGNRVYLIDWDDVLVSDEFRDLSLFLTHSEVPRKLWKIFFDGYGIEFSREEQIRFYWWLAFGELNIAYWCETAGYKEDVLKYMSQCDDSLIHLNRLITQ